MHTLDSNAARKGDATGSSIRELGKYNGKIIQAQDITAGTGTRGIALVLESNAGQKAKVALYTVKADGEKIMGYDTLCSIMTCLGLRGIAPRTGTVTYWDNEARAEKTKQGQVFSDLCNKPIGFLLETESYLKQDNSEGIRMVLKSVFQASTELTASEILDRKTVPEQLPRMVAGLRHRPLRRNASSTSMHGHAQAARAAAPAGGSGFDDMDDDIPF